MAHNTSGLKRDAGPGRPKGSKDRIPKSFKASIAKAYAELAAEEPTLYKDRIRRDVKSGRGSVGFHHIQLAAYYLDGKPVETVKVNGLSAAPIVVVLPPDQVS